MERRKDYRHLFRYRLSLRCARTKRVIADVATDDVSASGLGFYLQESIPNLDLGTTIRGATLRHRARTISMDLLVLHITENFAGEAVCGCLFYPASDADLRAFKEFLVDAAVLPATS